MVRRAVCPSCENPLLESNGPPSLAVILSVIGGLALVAFVVFFVVPLVRQRRVRHAYRPVDVENDKPSQPALASLHHGKALSNHHQNTPFGPDAMLPVLPSPSSLTWSPYHHEDGSVEYLDDEEARLLELHEAKVHTPPTANAAISHRSLTGMLHQGTSVSNGTPCVKNLMHASAGVLPSPTCSDPPGLPTMASTSLPHDKSALSALVDPAYLVLNNVSSRVDIVAPRPSRAMSRKSRVDSLEPLWEGDVSSKASTHLPSPPASPPLLHADPSPSHSRSRGQHSRSPSLQTSQVQADWRFNPSRRPQLSTTPSVPTALPFRPPAHTPSIASQLSRSQHSQSSSSSGAHSANPLTTAFRTSLAHSDSQSTRASPASDTGRYPYFPSSPIPEHGLPSSLSRSRAGSTASERPVRMAQEVRPRPTERRTSLSASMVPSLSYKSSSSASGSALIPITNADPTNAEEWEPSRTHLRSTESLQTPSPEEGPSRRSHRPAPSSFDPRTLDIGQGYSSNPNLQSSHPPALTPGSSASVSSRRASLSHPPLARSPQPPLVRRKDSTALKPIPASQFLYSPPSSPPARATIWENGPGVTSSLGSSSRTRQSVAGPRPRASSVAGPEQMGVGRARAASVSTLGRRGQYLPPLQPFSPLEFGQLAEDSDVSPKALQRE